MTYSHESFFINIDRRGGQQEFYPLSLRLADVTYFLHAAGESYEDLILSYYKEMINIAVNDHGISEGYMLLTELYWFMLKEIEQHVKHYPPESQLDTITSEKSDTP
jgi:hypothetical protein